MTQDLHQELSIALQDINASYAQMAAEPAAHIKSMPAPFLKRYRIYEVIYRAPNKPVVFYVGYAPDESAYLITGQPDNYVKVAAVDDVQIESETQAADYARLYLTVTRPMNKLFYVVDSTDQVKFRPGLKGKEAQTQAAFLKKYTLIQPAQAKRMNGQFQVTVYAIREQTLEQHIMTVDAQRQIHDQVTVLERDLPLVYGA